MNLKEIVDKDFGKITIRVNARARHIILYNKPEGIFITVPKGIGEEKVKETLEKYRHKLLGNRIQFKKQLIDLSYIIETTYFKLSFIKGTTDKFMARSATGRMEIICPENVDFQNEKLQVWLRKVINEALRKNAKQILIPKLNYLSDKLNIPYHQVKINSSKGRWGSCSAQKNINLSYYLILLPEHLIDYVLIHELCHTYEMNHSEKFWALVDRFTEGKGKVLRRELKKYQTEIP